MMTPMQGILAAAVLLALFSFVRAHKSKTTKFDAFDLIRHNGRVDKLAVGFMIALGVTTWVIVNLEITGKLTEGYLALYCTAWVAPIVAAFTSGNRSESTTSVSVTETTKEVSK